MAGVTRRDMLVGSGISTFALLKGARAFANGALEVPEVPMRLARRIERSLGDGATIVVERDWQIQFAPQGRGIAITGRQISASIDAPEKLARIAQVEQARSTKDMWPILLSEDGRIAAAGSYVRHEDFAAAVKEAEKVLAQKVSSEEALRQHRTHLAQLHRSGSTLLEELPDDLFYPKTERHELRRPVDLPGSLQGEFVLIYSASKAPGRPWLSASERMVTTRIGLDERHSSDRWTMSEWRA